MSDYYISISDKEPSDDGVLWFKISDALSEDEAYVVNKSEYDALKSDFSTAIDNLESVDKVKQVVRNIVEDTGFSVANAETGYRIVDSNNPQLQYNYKNIKAIEEDIDDLESSINEMNNYINTTLRTTLDNKLNVDDIETELKSTSTKPVASSAIKAEFDKYTLWEDVTREEVYSNYGDNVKKLLLEVNEGLGLAHFVLSYRTVFFEGWNNGISVEFERDKYLPSNKIRGVCHNSASGTNFNIIYVLNTVANGESIVFINKSAQSEVTVDIDIIYKYQGDNNQ
ncbi:MAG: hypothetical protein J6Y78_11085 [Paludibacteraceae bacterium]|nr:hypothetical protein [Paludibacteraceae bacterium]